MAAQTNQIQYQLGMIFDKLKIILPCLRKKLIKNIFVFKKESFTDEILCMVETKKIPLTKIFFGIDE